MTLLYVAIFVFLLNLPFGYWRADTRKFSLQWILAIHLPVPLVIIARLTSGLGYQLITFPVLIGAFFGGQFVGKKLYEIFRSDEQFRGTACLFVDLFRKTGKTH